VPEMNVKHNTAQPRIMHIQVLIGRVRVIGELSREVACNKCQRSALIHSTLCQISFLFSWLLRGFDGRTLLTRVCFHPIQKSAVCTWTDGKEKVHLQRELDRNLLPLMSLAGPLTSLP
jgi:hypothetical protein